MIYLDNSATTKPCAEAVAAMTEMLTDCWGNPSSLYSLGDKAARKLDEARRQVAALMGAEPERVFFITETLSLRSFTFSWLPFAFSLL